MTRERFSYLTAHAAHMGSHAPKQQHAGIWTRVANPLGEKALRGLTLDGASAFYRCSQ
jgi:hypothetical protein